MVDECDVEEKIETIQAHTTRYAKDAARERSKAAERAAMITEDHGLPDTAKAWITTLLDTIPWIPDAEAIERWKDRQLIAAIQNDTMSRAEKCALLGLDEEDVLEKAGFILDDERWWDGTQHSKRSANVLADQMAMFTLAKTGTRKGGDGENLGSM